MNFAESIFRWGLGFLFVFAGANHFFNPDFYLKIMPPFFPAPLFLVYLSGVFQIIFGVLLFVPRISRFAALGIIVVLFAVFPVNIYMAMNPQSFPEFSKTGLYLRLPLQFLLIAWAYRYAKKRE